MTMPWFRMFHEARNDAKLRSLTDAEFRVWFNLLCLASEQEERGVIRDAVPFLLAIETCNASVTLCNEALHRLCALRFIEAVWYHADSAVDGDEDTVTIRFLNWEKYQAGKPSDEPERVAERVKAHRERVKKERNAAVTPSNALHHPRNAIDKEEDRDKEEEKKGNTPPTPTGAVRVSDPADFDIFWQAYPRKENKPGALRAWKKIAPDALTVACIRTGLLAWKESDQWSRGIVPHAQTWLNARQWEDEPFAAVRAPNGRAEPVTFQQQIAINNRRNGAQFLAAVERHQSRGQQDIPDRDEQTGRVLPHGS